MWENSKEKNLECQCIPHSILVAVRRECENDIQIPFFDDEASLKETVIGCCKTTHVVNRERKVNRSMICVVLVFVYCWGRS